MRVNRSLGLITLVGTATVAMAAEPFAVEEIIVTASRRAQAVQDVAAAVAVVDPQQFAAGGVTSLTGVLAYVPGVNFNDNGAPGQGSITMRGVANIFATPSVGIYVDDIPYGSVTSFAEGANFALDALRTDIERVEVIKGPQGTLFGASSMGGSLRYITREPSLTEVEGKFATDLSETSQGGFNQMYKGGISVPIVRDRVALSVSGFYQDAEGFIDEATRPLDDVNDAELRGGQASLLFQASDEFKIRVGYTQQEFEFANTNAVPFNRVTGQPRFGKYTKNSATDQPTAIEFELTSATLEYDFGWATATLASSYQSFAQQAVLDLTVPFGPLVDGQLGVPVGTNIVLLDFDITTDRRAHELRLTSADNKQIEWLVGLYYTSEDSANFQGTDVRPGPFNLVTQEFPSDYEEQAAFGNLTYYFSEKFDATVGLRVSSNDMGVKFDGSGFFAGPPLPRTTVSDDVTTYLFNARYRPHDDLSLYLRVANGYRPASANLGLVDPASGNILSVPFVESDTLWSYEVGAKGSLADGSVGYDVAVYRLNWKDMQVFRSFMGVNVGGNADSDVTAHGVEATLTLQPSTSFDLVASVAYSQSELDEDDRSIGGVEGEQLPGIPQWTLSLSSTYRFPIGSLEAFVGGGVVYQDERKTSFIGGIGSNGVPIAPPNPNYTVPDYTAVDLRAGVTMGRYNFSVYATNAFDEYAFQRATTNTVQGTATILRPRTIGAVFSVDF
jgi:iron complex outermembrane receptor protein